MVYEIQTILRLMIETWMIVLWMIVSYPHCPVQHCKSTHLTNKQHDPINKIAVREGVKKQTVKKQSGWPLDKYVCDRFYLWNFWPIFLLYKLDKLHMNAWILIVSTPILCPDDKIQTFTWLQFCVLNISQPSLPWRQIPPRPLVAFLKSGRRAYTSLVAVDELWKHYFRLLILYGVELESHS